MAIFAGAAMTASEIVAHRLARQHLVGAPLGSPEDVVRWSGAVQAQDYYGAKWALGQRCGADDAAVEEAFNAGRILRTHLCRPTWHFVAAADIRWLLQLTAPRVDRVVSFQYRKLDLDERTLRRGDEAIGRALEGKGPLERTAIAEALRHAGFDVSGIRFVHLLMHAELSGVICSGPRRGRQFTYALLEERVPKVPAMDHDEALALLVRRYFSSRGPASLQDFCLWSGLTLADAKKGIALVKEDFTEVGINGRACWYPKDSVPPRIPANTVHLLPNYDEYGIGYKDRSAFYDPEEARAAGGASFRHMVLLNGRLIGTWDRDLGTNSVRPMFSLFRKPTIRVQAAIRAASLRYARFLGLDLAD